MAETGIKVKPYGDQAFEAAWISRSTGLWGTAAVGLATGAAMGLLAPFFPVLAGQQTLSGAAQLIPTSVAIFGATGMAVGFGAGALVGNTAGAAASIAEEHERREREREMALGKTSPA